MFFITNNFYKSERLATVYRPKPGIDEHKIKDTRC